MSERTVGFVGLGRMGAPMAANLARQGFRVVRYDPYRTGEVPPAEENWTESLADIAAADVSISMLPDGASTQAVLADPAFTDHAAAGHVHIAMGTIGTTRSRQLAAELRQIGVTFVDAPVSGSTLLAETAEISCMVGSDGATFEDIRPVLAAMTKAQLHMGPVGTGSAMKLAIQASIGVVNQVTAESLVLAERAGISREAALDAIDVSAIATPYARYKRSVYCAPDPKNAAVAAPVSLVQKDLRLTLEDAAEAGAPMPITQAALQLLDDATRQGYGAADMGSVIALLTDPADTQEGR